MRRLLPLVALVAALSLAAGACGDDLLSTAAAEVNGHEISRDDLERELDAIRTNRDYLSFLQSQNSAVFGQGTATWNATFVRQVLTRQIFLQLVHAEVVRRRLTVSDAELTRVRSDVEDEVGGPDILEKFPASYRNLLLRRSAEVAALQASLGGVDVDEAAVRSYYDSHPEEFQQTCVRHILFAVIDANGQVATEQTAAQDADLLAQASAARARIDAGEDFAALASTLSKDASNAADGGNLGCGAAGRFVTEFETAMQALQPGQVSAPVKTQFGYHLIKVDSRGPTPFEEVTDRIREQLLNEASSSFGSFLSKAVTEADVEVDPRYGTFSKNLQSPGVQAPAAPTTLPASGGTVPPPQSQLDLGG